MIIKSSAYLIRWKWWHSCSHQSTTPWAWERFEDKSWAAFQLVYTAPSAAECAALKDADKIWRGSLVSDRFAPRDIVVEK